MQPHEVQLLTMVTSLLAAMIASAAISAYAFRRYFSCGFIAGAFVATIVMIFVAVVFHDTQSPLIAFALAIGLGATIGADLGGFTIAVTEGKPRGREAVFVTLAILAVTTVVTAGIGLLSGFDFQGLRGVMFMGLLGILGVSLIFMFVRLGKVMEMVWGLAVSAFFMIYLIIDFNRIVDQYTEANWGAAVQVALSIFLDLVNIFVRLLPIIVELMDN